MIIDNPDAFEETRCRTRQALLDSRNSVGVWEGELSSSALSTATAVFALHLFLEAADKLEPESEFKILDPKTATRCMELIHAGLGWLALHQNSDGGWGDTTLSKSNISTTALCWAALAADSNLAASAYAHVNGAAEQWLTRHAGGFDPAHLVPAIIARYGKDKTFSVPILTMCALAGRRGAGGIAWKKIPQLPFEVAAFPQRWFKWMRLPVVSYALPALIAIGQVRHARRPTFNPVTRTLRALARKRTLKLLMRIQPGSGGFLEATPLTAFVVMSLIGAGNVAHAVVRQGMAFLIASARADGSWPIDTNLATWVTTLSVNALSIDPHFARTLSGSESNRLYDWLASQQYLKEHPYTLANPGGWAWTPLTGGVPDADDTPGALLALRNLDSGNERTKTIAANGIRWLLDLQNRDGGIPTFCRGWGTLPFDRSSADLSAHTLRAIDAWKQELPPDLATRAQAGALRAVEYLIRSQNPDGSWLPLWFGNQHAPDDANPTYGTARVILAAEAGRHGGERWNASIARGTQWLLSAQRPDGGWGAGNNTPASIEETALAVEALATLLNASLISDGERSASLSLVRGPEGWGKGPCVETAGIRGDYNIRPSPHRSSLGKTEREPEHLRPSNMAPTSADANPTFETADENYLHVAIRQGVNWLLHATHHGRKFEPSPIGFYFAKLWYFETLYPLIFTVAALEAVRAADVSIARPHTESSLLPDLDRV